MNDKKDTWTVTAELTVFAGDMEESNVRDNAYKLLTDLLDGTDFMNIAVTNAKRDE